MIFDLPFHNDLEYIDFINANATDIYSMYFDMDPSLVSDARIHQGVITTNTLIEGLSKIPSHIKKYVTINGRFTPLHMYDVQALERLTAELKKLHSKNCLTGILYLDYYFLSELGKIDSEFYSNIEAVPSINCFIDSFDKLNSHLMYIHDAGFKQPSKVILDRTLNRRMEQLNIFSSKVRKNYPELKMEILVNEGCLYNCPFKVNHDIMISMVNDQSVAGKMYILQNQQQINNSFNVNQLNENYGCIKYLDDNISRFFETPFVRPEDLHNYLNTVDVIKLSGRIKPNKFVFDAYMAYKSGIWEDNLLDIIDAAGALQNDYYIHNDEIPNTFHKMLTTCEKNCLQCRYCERVTQNIVQIIKKK